MPSIKPQGSACKSFLFESITRTPLAEGNTTRHRVGARGTDSSLPQPVGHIEVPSTAASSARTLPDIVGGKSARAATLAQPRYLHQVFVVPRRQDDEVGVGGWPVAPPGSLD